MAAVSPADARRTDSLVLVRFELGPWRLPHRVQPQVPAAPRLPTYTKLSGSSFPVASTHAAGWIEEDPSNACRQAGDTHTRAEARTMPPREPRFLRKPAQNPPLTFSPLPARPRLLVPLMQRQTQCWKTKALLTNFFCRIKMTVLAYNRDFSDFDTEH